MLLSKRVPPFLQSIEDPRVAQGGALKGCPVCGGTFFVSRTAAKRSLLILRRLLRSGPRHLELSKIGSYTEKANGVTQGRRRWRRILRVGLDVFCFDILFLCSCPYRSRPYQNDHSASLAPRG